MRRLVYSGRTDDHPVLVTDEEGVRSLRFGTEECQSCIDLERPWELQLAYTRWMATALLLPPRLTSFLVIGLGGGALPLFLLHHHPEAIIDVVEKEELVIQVAKTYFHLPDRANLRLLTQDARSFLGDAPAAAYDVAFLDIFGAGAMAEDLYDPGLYRGLLACLAPEGVLAVNLWSGERELFARAVRAAEQGSGCEALRMQVHRRSNVIALLFPGPIPRARIKQAAKESSRHQQRYGIEFARHLKQLRRSNHLGPYRFLHALGLG